MKVEFDNGWAEVEATADGTVDVKTSGDLDLSAIEALVLAENILQVQHEASADGDI